MVREVGNKNFTVQGADNLIKIPQNQKKRDPNAQMFLRCILGAIGTLFLGLAFLVPKFRKYILYGPEIINSNPETKKIYKFSKNHFPPTAEQPDSSESQEFIKNDNVRRRKPHLSVFPESKTIGEDNSNRPNLSTSSSLIQKNDDEGIVADLKKIEVFKDTYIEAKPNEKFPFKISSQVNLKELVPDFDDYVSDSDSESNSDENIQKSEIVILCRGCNKKQIKGMVKNGSAGGKESPNVNAERPDEESAKKQVGEMDSLPEFTTDRGKAENFGCNTFVAIFEIDSRYLTEGSPSEKGWVCDPRAPVKLIGWKEGRNV